MFLTSFPFNLRPKTSIHRFLHQFLLDIFLLDLSFLLNLIVIIINPLILIIRFPLIGLHKIAILHLLMQLLHLPRHRLILLQFLCLLPHLNIQSIHHLFSKHLRFLFMLSLGLHSYIQMIPWILISKSWSSTSFYLLFILLLYCLSLRDLLVLQSYLPLTLRLSLLSQFLIIVSIRFSLLHLAIILPIQLLVQLSPISNYNSTENFISSLCRSFFI